MLPEKEQTEIFKKISEGVIRMAYVKNHRINRNRNGKKGQKKMKMQHMK